MAVSGDCVVSRQFRTSVVCAEGGGCFLSLERLMAMEGAKGGDCAQDVGAIVVKKCPRLWSFRALRMLRHNCSFKSLRIVFVGISPCAKKVIVQCHCGRTSSKTADYAQ